ncbi:MAG: sugar dehydrogenase complex small subunit [Betaproteobacteria bacterium]
MNADRRKLLQALASLSSMLLAYPLGAATQPASGSMSAEKFAALSATLTGYPAADPSVTAKLLTAFATPARSASLERLAALVAATPDAELDSALRAQGLDTFANELVAAWYSGVVKNGNSAQLVLYTDAYVWSAMTFSKPMGLCGGAFGY